MITRILHAITDGSTSRRGKFVTIVLWLVIAVALTLAAPKVASLYDNSKGQSIPSGADSQVAQRLLLNEFPSSRGTPAILVFYDPGGLGVADRIRIKQVSDWLTSDEKPAAVSSLVSVFTVPQGAAQFIQDIASFFQTPSGPPPFEETGGMAALVAGGSGWIKIHLEPGNYAALSFIPNERTGKPQFTLGMILPFTVR